MIICSFVVGGDVVVVGVVVVRILVSNIKSFVVDGDIVVVDVVC